MALPARSWFTERIVPFSAGDGMACKPVDVRPEAPAIGVPRYSHLDVFVGHTAALDAFPFIESALARAN